MILPIAGLILTFVATYELIQMLIDRNNLHDIDTWLFFKWIFKTAAAILILSNTFNIVNAVFDVSQSVIARSAGVIQGSTDITPDMLATLEATLETMELGSLLGLFMQTMLIGLTMKALSIIIFVLVYNKAYYSLDCDDGIEYSACVHEPSPQELLERMDRFCHLWNALNSLPEIQGRRVDAHLILGKSYREIARDEGVDKSAVRSSVLCGIEAMKKYLRKNL